MRARLLKLQAVVVPLLRLHFSLVELVGHQCRLCRFLVRVVRERVARFSLLPGLCGAQVVEVVPERF